MCGHRYGYTNPWVLFLSAKDRIWKCAHITGLGKLLTLRQPDKLDFSLEANSAKGTLVQGPSLHPSAIIGYLSCIPRLLEYCRHGHSRDSTVQDFP